MFFDLSTPSKRNIDDREKKKKENRMVKIEELYIDPKLDLDSKFLGRTSFSHASIKYLLIKTIPYSKYRSFDMCHVFTRDLRVSFPPFSWGKVWPLIGQAAHGRMAGIIVLNAWPIRGDFFPHENGGKLTLRSLVDT